MMPAASERIIFSISGFASSACASL
ncbi:hypothetical protein YPPY64_2935, partial [Yersinia pestis PY-64]